jgi:hypothetical protein
MVNSAALRNPGLKNVVTAREVELSVFTSVAPSRLPSSPVSTIREPALMGALIFCALLRVAFYLRFGLAFDANANMWQMQDVVWLRDSPFEAIYLMHMQPPLLNALYATALQLPVGAAPIFLQFLFVVASAVMVILIYGQLRHFGSRPAIAGTLAGLFGILPQTLLYENVFGYQHFEAALILAASLAASAYLVRGRLAAFTAFAGCITTLALLRSQYHIGWVAFVLVAVLILASRRFGWRLSHAAAALAALATVTSVYLKNYAVFGAFSASSWFGMTTAQMVTPFMPGDNEDFPDLQRDVAERTRRGEFSPAMAGVVARKNVWDGWIVTARDCSANSDKKPELCALRRSSGMENFNHEKILKYSPDLGKDAFHLLRLYPSLYLDHLLASVLTTLGTPSWDYRDLPKRLEHYTSLWNGLLGYTSGQALEQTGGAGRWWRSLANLFAAASLPLMIAIVLATAIIFSRASREVCAYWRGQSQAVFWLFPALALLLAFSVPHLINGVETQRIRYTVEPVLYLALIECVGVVVTISASALAPLRSVFQRVLAHLPPLLTPFSAAVAKRSPTKDRCP